MRMAAVQEVRAARYQPDGVYRLTFRQCRPSQLRRHLEKLRDLFGEYCIEEIKLWGYLEPKTEKVAEGPIFATVSPMVVKRMARKYYTVELDGTEVQVTIDDGRIEVLLDTDQP